MRSIIAVALGLILVIIGAYVSFWVIGMSMSFGYADENRVAAILTACLIAVIVGITLVWKGFRKVES
jgi:hypothetical protein